MKLGTFMMPLHPPGRSPSETLPEDREAILLADRLGYVEALVGEHVTDLAENVTSCLMFLASLAYETKNIVLTPKTRTVTVEVASSRGTAIAGATVSLSRGGSTTPITAPTTNSLGITQFTAVNPGPQNLTDTPYRLTVSASNHAPLTAKAAE